VHDVLLTDEQAPPIGKGNLARVLPSKEFKGLLREQGPTIVLCC